MSPAYPKPFELGQKGRGEQIKNPTHLLNIITWNNVLNTQSCVSAVKFTKWFYSVVVRSIFSFSRKQRPLILKQTDRGSLAIEAPSSGKKREVGAQIILLHHTACAVSRRDILAIHVTDRGVILYPPSSINIITCNTLVNTRRCCVPAVNPPQRQIGPQKGRHS